MSNMKEYIRGIVREELKALLGVDDNPQQSNSLFDVFWKAYPRKAGKLNAKQAWDKLSPSEDLAYKIIAAAKKQKVVLWAAIEKRYIPHAGTWLRGERWRDELPEEDTADVLNLPPRKPTDDELALIKGV